MPKKTVSKNDQPMTLADILIVKLKTLYNAENQLAKALPKIAKSVTDPALRRCLEAHVKQAGNHIKRLEQAFDALGARAQKLEGEAIAGLIADMEWIPKHIKGVAGIDASLAAAAQGIKQYQIAGYESGVAWAKLLEQDKIADLLHEGVDEESESNVEFGELSEAQASELIPDDDEDDEKNKDGDEDEEDQESEDGVDD